MRTAVRIVAGFLALVVWLPALSVADLVFGLLPTDDDGSAVGNVGYGVVAAVLVGGALASQVHAPERKIAPLQQIPLVALALVLASVATGEYIGFAGAAIVLLPLLIVLALHPLRRDVLRAPHRASRNLVALALVVAAPLLVYAWTAAADERGGRLPEDSYSVIASIGAAAVGAAVAIVLVAFLAALRPTGWHVSATLAGIGALLLGAVFAIHPDAPASAGRAWGGALVAWSVAWLAVTFRTRREDSPENPPG